MSTTTKTPRAKYRFADRKSAEDAQADTAHQLAITSRMLTAKLLGSPLHTIIVGRLTAILQTHHWMGKELHQPGIVLIDSSSTTDGPCVWGPCQCAYRFCQDWCDYPAKYQEQFDTRELAHQVRTILNSGK